MADLYKIDQNGQRVPLTDTEIAQVRIDAQQVMQLYFINKVTMWSRCTADEAKALSAALQDAPAQQQEIFRAALIIDIRDDLYPVLYGSLVSLLGKARADAILAPTE